jgi:hypothetical protein
VLVAYTPAAKAAAGGLNGMLALIDLAVLETNTSYANGHAALLMRLVLAHETDYTETSSMTFDLNRFQSPWDGQMDEVHTLRDQVGADACALLVDDVDPMWCGYGFQGGWPAQPGFASVAFNVTKYWCATGHYIFGHEFGHNFSLDHDIPNNGSMHTPYGYGYVTPGGEYQTVMAIAGSPRVPVFSSPLADRDGFSMGEVDVADSGRALTENNFVISNWRPAQIPFADCNSNLVDDELELAFGSLTDADGDGVPDECTFEDLGSALGGSYGEPALTGQGTLLAGDPVVIRLSGARENAPAFFVVGLERVDLPFLGGTIVPAFEPPLGLFALVVTDDVGGLALEVDFPPGIPPDTEIYCQYWIQDEPTPPPDPNQDASPIVAELVCITTPFGQYCYFQPDDTRIGVGLGPDYPGAPFGVAASNAIGATTP